MKSLQFSAVAVAFASASLLFTGCKKDDDKVTPAATVGTVDMEFENQVGETDLALNTGSYTTPAGESFTVTKFLYYVSNIKFTKADGSSYAVPNSYYLVNEADDASKHLALTDVPVGDYRSVSFVVGVDSARNVAGAQTGALDPNNNMFWSWNSGYIYLKMEGTSPQSPNNGNGVIFHIGGFKSPTNTIRSVTATVPSGGIVAVRGDHHPEIHMKADVMKMFSGPTPIRFGNTGPAGTTQINNTMGGANSVKVANNYATATDGMFSVEHVHAN